MEQENESPFEDSDQSREFNPFSDDSFHVDRYESVCATQFMGSYREYSVHLNRQIKKTRDPATKVHLQRDLEEVLKRAEQEDTQQFRRRQRETTHVAYK